MKAKYNASDKLVFELEGESQKDIFKALSVVQEVFSEDKCGVCGCQDLRFVVRTVEDNDYYELQCKNFKCRAKLGFGQHKKNKTLFPRRKDNDGKFIPNNGWEKWVPSATPASTS